MVIVEYKIVNKSLTGYSVKNLTDNSHLSPYGIYGVVKNQTLRGVGTIKDNMLYVTWDIGGCTMLEYDKAIELGFLITEDI